MQKFRKRVLINPHQLTNFTQCHLKTPLSHTVSLFWPFSKFGRFQSAKYNTINKNVSKWTVFFNTSKFESKNHIWLRNFHEQQIFQLKPIKNRVYERDSLFQIQKVCFICSIHHQNSNFCKSTLSFVQKFWKRVQIDLHQLTNTTLALPKSYFIANCNITLTIMQSLFGFNQPSTTESTKTFGMDHVFVKTSKF